jgi:hypothetical protein
MSKSASGKVTSFNIDPDHGSYASFFLDQTNEPNSGDLLNRANQNQPGVNGYGMITTSTPFHERVADAVKEAYFANTRITVSWEKDGGSDGNGHYPDIRRVKLG